MQSHRAVFLSTAALFAVQTRTERDVMLNALPLPHVYGNIVMNGTFMAGATLVMMERFDPAVALAEIQRQHATVFDGVPTMYAMMLAAPSMPGADLSSLRICAVGGQTMPVAKMVEWEARSGAPLLELWGMTELGGAGTSNCSYLPNVHDSIGFALPGAEAPGGRAGRCEPHGTRRRAGRADDPGPAGHARLLRQRAGYHSRDRARRLDAHRGHRQP
jgi:long-chain acyl-CoA synthetase